MITDAILTAIIGIVNAILALLPTFSMPTPFADGSTGYISAIWEVERVFPIQQLLLSAGVYLGIRIAMQLWDFGLWIYHQVWGSD